jgi:hypothetical protein
MHLALTGIAAGTPDDDHQVAGFQSVLCNTCVAEPARIGPFSSVGFDASLRSPCLEQQQGMWAPELEFLYFSLECRRLVFEIVGRE